MPANIRKMLIAAAATIGTAPSAFADVITDWNEKGVAYVTGKMAPAAAQRIMAITHVAMFDAVNSIDRRYRPYLVQLPAGATTSKEAAATAAAGTVLAVLNSQAEGEFKGAMAAYLAGIPDSESKTQGIALGEAVAAKILAARANDGSEAPDSYRPKTRPGVYVPTPPMVSSTWPNLKPFAMKSPSQFRPGPPISLKSAE